MRNQSLTFISFIASSPLLSEFIPSSEVRNFIGCQFALESDFGRSDRALLDFNLCGMKRPYKRFSFCKFSSNGFAVYDSWFTCIKDYIVWLLYNRPSQNVLENLDSFIIFLRNSGYCPEKDYIDKIQSIYKTYFNN